MFQKQGYHLAYLSVSDSLHESFVLSSKSLEEDVNHIKETREASQQIAEMKM